jgi:hypothetical protein
LAPRVIPAGEIERDYRWATDTYRAPGISLCFITPFFSVPDMETARYEDKRFYLCPAFLLELELDNESSQKGMTAFFGLGGVNRLFSSGSRAGLDSRDDFADCLLGAGQGERWGFACRPAPGLREHLTWEFLDSLYSRRSGQNGFHRLGTEGGIVIDVAPGARRRVQIALGSFQDGIVTSGLESRFFYSSCFRGLLDVLDFELEHAAEYRQAALERDGELLSSGLGASRQGLIAHATRGYLANTELLLTRAGETLFVVNEGEYRMMNTLDLSVDQMFWESRYSPWTLRNELDVLLKYSSYRDNKGLCFCHDQGVANSFAPPGLSTYEVPQLKGCFSFMTYEETLNWALMAAFYAEQSGDLDWLKARAADIRAVLDSCLARDADGDGLMDADSDRCVSGTEITTYDSLDSSLGQARGSLYLAVKTVAAYLGLSRLLLQTGDAEGGQRALSAALCAANSVSARFDPKAGYIPAVFEANSRSVVIPAIEALIYPYFSGNREIFRPDSPFAPLIGRLKSHLESALKPGLCIDEGSGAWKISSTSCNTWLSKIFLNQYVAKEILGYASDRWEAWDEILLGFQKNESREYAATDQVHSSTGKDLGSRLYPRLVTSALPLLCMRLKP